MEAPGLSLFQGHTNININDDDVQKELEEEARKEQEERNKELGNQLMNAFDDLDELDEDDTVDNSANLISRISHNDDDAFSRQQTPVLTNGYAYQSDGSDYITHSDKLNVHMQYKNRGSGDDNYCNYADEERKYLDSKFGSIEQLKVLYDVRVCEVQNLTTQLEESRIHSEHTIAELRKQLLLCEADKERAVLTRQQAQELLVHTKSELGESHNKIDSLNSTIKYLEQEKESLKNELMITKASLQDSYQRLQIIDRGFSNDKQLEVILKGMKERHAEETKNLENTIQHMKNRLENCDIEIKQLETKNRELHRDREKMVIDKAETVNELAKKLEETQKQYQTLFNSKTSGEVLDAAEMKIKYNSMQSENETLKNQLDDALNMLEALQMEGVSSQNVDTESEVETDSMHDMNLNKNKRTNKLDLTDKLFKLQNELYRMMQMHKERRNEIKLLQEALTNKEAQIKSLQENESQVIFQAAHYREESVKLAEKLTHANEKLQSIEENMPKHNEMVVEINREKNTLLQDCEKLKKENMRLCQKIDSMEMMNTNSEDADVEIQTKSNRTVIEALKMENKTLLDKISDLEHFSRMGKMITAESTPLTTLKPNYYNRSPGKEELRSLHKEVDKLKFQLNDAQREIDKYKTLYIELSVEKEKLVKELNDFKGQDFVVKLRDMQNVVNKLENELQESNNRICVLNDELLQSGKSFKCTDHADVIIKLETECQKLKDNCMNHKRDIIDLNKKLMDAGQEINDLKIDLDSRKNRDDMIEDMKQKAQKFEEFMIQNMKTKKLDNKSIGVETDIKVDLNHADVLQCERKIRDEMSLLFAEEIHKIRERHDNDKAILEDKLQLLEQALEARTKDVEVLKSLIFTERQTYKQVLEEKNNIINTNSGVNIKQEYEMKIAVCENKIKSLMATLEETQKLLQTERNDNLSMKTKLLNENQFLQEQVMDIERRLSVLSEKYSKSKKVIENYKSYIADKEEHFMNEVERIKQGYEEAKTKMQIKMEKNIEMHKIEISDKLKDMEAQYERKLQNLRKECQSPTRY